MCVCVWLPLHITGGLRLCGPAELSIMGSIYVCAVSSHCIHCISRTKPQYKPPFQAPFILHLQSQAIYRRFPKFLRYPLNHPSHG